MTNETNVGKQGRLRRIWAWLAHRKLMGAMGGVTLSIVTYYVIKVIERARAPDSYKIYVVADFRQLTKRQIWDALSSHKEQLPSFGGVKVELIKEDDRGDPVDAKRISEMIAARDDVLLVVGHMASTQTNEALPAYFEKAIPAIPVILVTETNPNLLPKPPSDDSFFPVFRLAPTDEKQAEIAANFALEKGASSFWVVQDIRYNDLYSRYLAEKFTEEVQAKSGKVVLWSTNDSVPSVDAIRSLKIDCVFFPGLWQNALILVQQVKAMSQLGKKPMIILTNSSVSPSLLKQGANDVEGVFLTYPMTARVYAEKGSAVYGNETFMVLEELLEVGNAHFADLAHKDGGVAYALRRIFRVKSVTDARRVLSAEMEKAVRDQQKFTLEEGVEAQFGAPEGARRDATFYVWKVCNGNFMDESESCVASEHKSLTDAAVQ